MIVDWGYGDEKQRQNTKDVHSQADVGAVDSKDGREGEIIDFVALDFHCVSEADVGETDGAPRITREDGCGGYHVKNVDRPERDNNQSKITGPWPGMTPI